MVSKKITLTNWEIHKKNIQAIQWVGRKKSGHLRNLGDLLQFGRNLHAWVICVLVYIIFRAGSGCLNFGGKLKKFKLS